MLDEKFNSKVKTKYGNKFQVLDSLCSLNNKSSKARILCLEHGEFIITKYNFLQSRNGCPCCGKIKKSENKKNSLDKIILKFEKVHNKRYNYSKIEYVKNHYPVIIICKDHGEFLQTPKIHSRGADCPECVKIKIKNTRITKYGNYNSLENRKIASNTCKKQHINGNFSDGMIKKYGKPNCMQVSSIRDKIINTILIKYGIFLIRK